MKKHNLLKVMGISFLLLVVASWIIPTGTYSGSTFTEGTTEPVGFIDLFRIPLITLGTFFQYGLVLVAIGGFYGVLEKTGAYHKLVDKLTTKFKGKETRFLVITMIILTLLSSLTALSMPLFILVPFFAAVILVMGFGKITALASTVGAILVGMIGSTYGFSVSGYINNFFNLDVNNEIFTKIILFVIVTFLLIIFVTGRAKKELKANTKEIQKTKKEDKKKDKKNKTENQKEVVIIEKEEKEIPFYEKNNNNKKSYWPIIIITIIMVIFLLVAMYNWTYGLGVTFFQETYESLMGVTVGNEYPIIANIFGNVSQIGYWGNYELVVVLMIASLLIAWIYSIKMNNMIEGFTSGAKRMLETAVYATLASVVFAVMINSQTGSTIFATISNFFFTLTEEANLALTALPALTGSLLYNDFYYLLSIVTGVLTTNFTANELPVIGLIYQTIYGIAMMILPTSIVLVAGLKYFNVSFKEWFKYIWKLLLQLIVVCAIVIVIVAIFV